MAEKKYINVWEKNFVIRDDIKSITKMGGNYGMPGKWEGILYWSLKLLFLLFWAGILIIFYGMVTAFTNLPDIELNFLFFTPLWLVLMFFSTLMLGWANKDSDGLISLVVKMSDGEEHVFYGKSKNINEKLVFLLKELDVSSN